MADYVLIKTNSAAAKIGLKKLEYAFVKNSGRTPPGDKALPVALNSDDPPGRGC